VEADIDQIRQAVHDAVKLRPPKFEEGEHPRNKVTAFEDYLLQSAWTRAELEECVFWLDATIAQLKAKVEQMTGYEALLPRKPQDRITQADIVTAKQKMDGPTFEAGAEAKHLREHARRQIARFEFEAQWVISRAYTMISGGS